MHAERSAILAYVHMYDISYTFIQHSHSFIPHAPATSHHAWLSERCHVSAMRAARHHHAARQPYMYGWAAGGQCAHDRSRGAPAGARVDTHLRAISHRRGAAAAERSSVKRVADAGHADDCAFVACACFLARCYTTLYACACWRCNTTSY